MSDTSEVLAQKIARKISSPELLKLAVDGSDERASVLIEVDVPRQQVEIGKTMRKGVEVYAPARVSPESAKELEAIERTTAKAGEFLTEILGTPPVCLRSARAFVANVSGKQLMAIALSPLTRGIKPNRRLTSAKM